MRRQRQERTKTMKDTSFNIDTDRLSDKDKEIAKVLLKNKDSIIKSLVEQGIDEDAERPYTYYVPTGLFFDCGNKSYQIRSLWAIVILARACGARACWLDCDKEGYPELPQFCGCRNGFHRVMITDPFAFWIDLAVREYKERLVKEGKARIVNGKFYKVA